jgi:hypothetical protein
MIRDPSDGSTYEISDDDVVACGNAGKQRIAAGPAMTGTSEDTTQGDRPAATVKVRSSGTIIDTSTSGLPITKAKADYLARLEESRKWLKAYVRPTIIEKGQ